jgi:hypothetical protein
MSSNSFEIVFHGVVVPGSNPAQVKKNVAGLFKTELAKIEPLFSGKRFVLKKGLDHVTAQRYQKALREAGAIVEVVDAAASANVAAARLTGTAPQKAVAPATARPAPGVTSAAPARTPVVTNTATAANKPVLPPSRPAAAAPKPAPNAAAHRTAGVTIAPPGAVLVAPEKVEPRRIDTSGLSLDKPGVILVQPTVVPDLKVDLSALSMAEPGTVLKALEKVRDLVVDTSALSMAEPGVTLIEPEKVVVPKIDTSKIALA